MAKPRNIIMQLNQVIDFDATVPLSLLCESFDTPVSLGVYLRLKYKEFNQLVTMDIRPIDYLNPDAYFIDRQCSVFLKKYPSLPLNNIDPNHRAMEIFLEGEARCKKYNEIFFNWRVGKHSFSDACESVIFAARHKICQLLGSINIEQWLDDMRFSGGASCGIPGTSDVSKLSEGVSITPLLSGFSQAILNEFPGWINGLTNGGNVSCEPIVSHGKYSQVPKTALVNRNIEVQPSLNMFVQLGLAAHIRRRLKVVGIDISSQEHNRNAACKGSIDGSLATIDLSNASDTICEGVVRALLPSDWLHALNIARTHFISMPDGSLRPLSRFSAMGNGFTFELETLIFWALSKSACELVSPHSKILVYGDDIIVPTSCSAVVIEVLEEVGFQVNRDKSFVTGPFRESCGLDCFDGVNVRPFFLTKEVSNVEDCISLANGIKRIAGRLNCNFGYDRRFAAAWYYCLRRIPCTIRRRLAFGYAEDDSYILHFRNKKGKAVIFKQKNIPVQMWHTAKASALYRCYKRTGSYVTYCYFNGVFGQSLSHGSYLKEPSSGSIFDYRRDCGRWGLKRVRDYVAHSPFENWW